MLHNLVEGLTALHSGPSIGYLFLGALIGMFIGVIPGLGGAVVLSIVLAFVYHLDVNATLCLFLGTHAGSYFSASIASILLNTPAHPEAFAVTFDGYPMSQRGEAGRALGISAASTCIGGLIGCAVLVGFIQIINALPQIFHPPDYVALIAIAMLLIGTLGTDQVSKAIISGGLGLMVASIGSSVVTGTIRYAFGSVALYSGVSLVTMALGSFAVPQMVMVFGTGTTVARQDMTGKEIDRSEAVQLSHGFAAQVIGGVFETFRHWFLLITSALIGVITGIIPGIGGFSANFLSYGVAQQTSKKREQFGKGIPEGIIAPEGSSLSKEAGGLVPILALGIPGGVGGALFLAALTIKGVKTGYGFTTAYPVLPYEMVWIVALAGLIGTTAGVLAAPLLAKVTKVPGPILVPFILALAVLGPYIADVTFFDVTSLLAFAVIGLLLRRLRYSLATFVIGLVLGPTFEANVYLTHNIYPGFTFVRRPLTDVLIVIAVAIVVLKTVQLHREKVIARRRGEEELAAASEADARSQIVEQQRSRRAPYPLLGVIVTVALLAISIPFVVYGIDKYNFSTAIMPVIAGFLVILPALSRLPRDAGDYLAFRRSRVRSTEANRSEAVNAPETELSGGVPSAQEASAVGAAINVLVRPPMTDPIAGRLDSMIHARPVYHDIVEKAWGLHGQYTREVAAFAWLFGLVLGCYLFSFVWAIPAFCVAYGITCTRRFIGNLRSRVVFSVVSAAVMWAVTYEIFNVLHLTMTPIVNF